MFYKFFKKEYFKLWTRIEEEDSKRFFDKSDYQKIQVNSYKYNTLVEQKLPIYSFKNTASDEKKPLLIHIHGGGWFLSNFESYHSFLASIADSDIDTISFGYRTMKDNVLLNDMIKDIFTFLKWIKINANKLKVSFDNLFLSGDSAGAQLLLLIYAINEDKNLQKLFDVERIDLPIKGIILNHPVNYLDNAAILKKHKLLSRFVFVPSFLQMIFGKHYKNMESYKFSKPEVFIPLIKNKVKTLIVSSSGDELFNEHSYTLFDDLKKNTFNIEFYYEKDINAGHVYNIINPNDEKSKRANERIIDFIKK